MKRPIRTALKKPEDSSKQLVLREIIGLTLTDCNGLASSVSSSIFVYVAGCVAVVYGMDSGRQSHLVVSHRTPRPLSCVALSRDGRFVAAGESGRQPSVLVWDCLSQTLISELKGHLYGVKSVSFSPDGIYLCSVGRYLHLWEWRIGKLSKKLKAGSSCSDISSVGFSSDAKFVVTSGKKHLKFWAVDQASKTRSNKVFKSLGMNGSSVDLGLQKESTFVSIGSDMCFLYALTESGVLLVIPYGLSIRKSVDLKVEKGYALSVGENIIACACSNGIVRLFTTETLKHTGTLLYPKDRKISGKNHKASNVKDTENDSQTLSSLPNAVACQFTTSKKLVVVYEDHSLYVWNIQNINQATRCYVLFSHAACIWDIKNMCCDNGHDHSLGCVARGCSGEISFVTCSSDGTVRLWDLLAQADSSEDLVRTAAFERDFMELDSSSKGFRSIAMSSNGKYLAAGDTKGSIHIYDLNDFHHTCLKDVHDSEVLSLSFGLTRLNSSFFLSSGGRDGLINLYDAKRNFDLVKTIDDHSAAVTSVKLASDDCKILSCSTDSSLVFRNGTVTSDGFRISNYLHQTASQGTVYDMAVDSRMEIAVTVGQDGKISTFDIASGKLIRSFNQKKDFGDPIKVVMDPSCSYMVCLYSNKSLCIYDFITGDLVTQATGHGEIMTGVIFLPDLKHIVSVSGDGCIFVWELPANLSSTMHQRINEKLCPLSRESLVQSRALSKKIPFREIIEPKDNELVGNIDDTLEFKFSVSRLPRWAQDKVTCSDFVVRELDLTSQQEVKTERVSSPSGPDIQGSTHDSCGPQIHENEAFHINSSTSSSCDKDDCASSVERGTSFVSDKRWNCVYTLCFLNSPDVSGVKDKNQIQMHSLKDAFRSSSEEADLFKKHFGSLSSTHKIEQGRPSKRQRLTSRFGSQQQGDDGGFKKLLESASKSLNGNSSTDEQKMSHSCKQDPRNKLLRDSEENDESGKIISCRDALLALDSAADNAVRLFSELTNSVFSEEMCKKLIPSVLEKLNYAAELLQTRP